MQAKLNERIERLARVDGIDPRFILVLRECLKIDPDDVFNPDSYPIYPGSDKGSQPEDDPEFYDKWSAEHQQPFVKRFLDLFAARVTEIKDVDSGSKSTQNDDDHTVMNMHQIVGKDISVADYINEDNDGGSENGSATFIFEYPHELPEYMKTDIPLIPKNLPIEANAQRHTLTDWTLMRNAILIKQFIEGFTADTGSAESEDPFEESYYPTLFPYYNLLPKHMREHPGVYHALIGLEKFSPQLTLEQKQIQLNKVCMMCLPDPDCKLTRLD
jgi:hypothetical protein